MSNNFNIANKGIKLTLG